MRTSLKLATAAVLVAVIVAVLASKQVQDFLAGYNSTIIILALAIIAALALIGKGIYDVSVNAFKEGIVPIDKVTAFVEDIQFELPTIPRRLLSRQVTLGELDELKVKFTALKEPVILSDDEAQKINQLARASFNLRDVLSNVPYDLQGIYTDFLYDPLYFGHRFSTYSAITRRWSDFLGRRKLDDAAKAMDGFIKSEISKTMSDSISISRHIISLASNQEIDLSADLSSPRKPELADLVSSFHQSSAFNDQGVPTPRLSNDVFLVLRSQPIFLGSQTKWQEKPIQQYVELFTTANISRLAEVFEDAEKAFEEQSRRMKAYLETWNSILTDRQSSLFVLTATLSNLGRFDSFVRAKGKVIIGTPGTKTPIEFIVGQYEEDSAQVSRGQYISVESRRTRTVRFLARLEDNQRQSVRAAYESGLVYVRLALLVSSGKQERKIVSASSPFSVEARKQHDEAVSRMVINI